ncbi:MAG TPA: hypothetical protein PL009_09835 [Flavipsychrobacter sp.]|nr:hypothetical protein [Flavipsychrobacter sp.]
MSHETHHSHTEASPKISYSAAFWFVLIMVGLFLGAVNFVNVMGHDEGGGHGATHEPKIQTGSKTLENETGLGAPAETTSQHHGSNSAADSTHMEGH